LGLIKREVYSYELILKEVKELLIPTIINSINPKDIETTGLSKEDLAEIIYSQIMALGYNDQDINSSLNDLMPTRHPILYPGPEETDAVNMAIHLCAICKDFEYQLSAFKDFHKMTQDMKSHDEVMLNIKLRILPIL